jgi:hypothetical protein
MGVEARKRQTRLGNAEPFAQFARRNARHFKNIFGRELSRHFGKRNVNGHRHCAQLRSGQHHHRSDFGTNVTASKLRQKFRMSRMSETGFIKRLLGNRASDDSGRLTSERESDGAFNCFNGTGCIFRQRFAGAFRVLVDERQDRQGTRKNAPRCGDICNCLNLNVEIEKPRTRFQLCGICQQHEGRQG